MTTTTPQKPRDLSEYIRSVVDDAPPLTASQKAKLTVLLSHRKPAGTGERV